MSDPSDGVRWMRVAGEIDIAGRSVLAEALRAAIAGTGVAEVVIDLSELRFIDAGGVRVLFDAARLARAGGVGLRVRGLTGIVETVLHLTGAAELLGVAPIPGAGSERTRLQPSRDARPGRP